MRCPLLSCALLALCSPAFAQGASASSELPFLRPLDELASVHAGEQLAFRFRRVAFAGDGAPQKVQDGVVKLAFRLDGVSLEEAFIDSSDEDGHVPVPRVVTSFFSFTSGEYARVFERAGDIAGQALVERWKGLPQIVFASLGLFGAPGALAEFEVREHGIASGEHAVTRLRSPSGDELAFEFTRGELARLDGARSSSADGAVSDWLTFEDFSAGHPSWPARPTRIVEGRTRADGSIASVNVWCAIDGDWAAREIEGVARAGSGFADLRADRASVAQVTLDREVTLESLLTWEGAHVAPSEAGGTEHRRAPELASTVEPPPREPGSRWGLLAGAGVIASVATVSWAASVRRRRNA